MKKTTYYLLCTLLLNANFLIANNVLTKHATFNSVTISNFAVTPPPVAGEVTVPYNEVCNGTNSVLLTLTGYDGDIQWQSSTDNSTFTDITGEVSDQYTATDLTTTTYFRAQVSSVGFDSVTSNVVMITVSPDSVGGTVSEVYYKCTGGGQITLVGSVGDIQWQKSTNNVTFNDIDGENSATLTFSGLTATTYYRAALYSGSCSSAFSDTYTALIKTTTFSGSEWSNGDPDSATMTTISASYTATTDVSACTLTVTNNSIVIIPEGKNLLLGDKVTVDSGSQLILKNNTNLLQASNIQNTGSITVKRNSASLMRLDYTLWSAPVVGQTLGSFSPSTLSNRFYTYNPSSDVYEVVSSTAATFATGKGYLIRMPNNHPTSPTTWSGQFSGVPNNGAIDVTVTDAAYNAIGNPYPSNIDADTFITDNGVTEALYFWRKTNNSGNSSYATYTLAGGVGTANADDPLGIVPNGKIQVGQGFIVKATSGTIHFTNSMREANNDNQFLKASQEKSRYWLNLTSTTGVFSQTMVAYMNAATNEYDAAIDGKFFNDTQTALTSIINDQEFTIQGRSLPFSSNDQVALGFKSATAGNYTISIDHTDGLFANSQTLYLKDNVTNTLHDLSQGGYTFSTTAGFFNDRFVIVYQNMLGVGAPTFTSNSLIVFSKNHEITINAGKAVLDNVKVYDIQGRLLKDVESINASEVKLLMDATTEMVFVKATSTEGITITKRVFK